MALREIVKIDKNLCDGCGDCILSCAEGALQIIDGKAKLVSDTLCDGFGACLGSCPQDAITIIKREADEFDEDAVEEHLERNEPQKATEAGEKAKSPEPVEFIQPGSRSGGCPGSAMRMFPSADESVEETESAKGEISSHLTQWPVQLMLVPPTAPFLKGREILLAADCCPFAYADFHRKFLKGRALLVACPKLDDLDFYRRKLEDIFRDSGCTGVTVMMMEVPCCGGLRHAAEQALRASGRDIPMNEIIIGVPGNILHDAKVG